MGASPLLEKARPRTPQETDISTVVLGKSIHLEGDPLLGYRPVSTSGRFRTFNDTAADILVSAHQPIAVLDLIAVVVERHAGELRPVDVLAFIDCAISEGWLRYTELNGR